jgi:hypothetical protein
MNAKMSEAQSFGGLGFVVWLINAPNRFPAPVQSEGLMPA